MPRTLEKMSLRTSKLIIQMMKSKVRKSLAAMGTSSMGKISMKFKLRTKAVMKTAKKKSVVDLSTTARLRWVKTGSKSKTNLRGNYCQRLRELRTKRATKKRRIKAPPLHLTKNSRICLTMTLMKTKKLRSISAQTQSENGHFRKETLTFKRVGGKAGLDRNASANDLIKSKLMNRLIKLLVQVLQVSRAALVDAWHV